MIREYNTVDILEINVAGGQESSLNRNWIPELLAFRASALAAKLFRPNILADYHTPGYPLTKTFIVEAWIGSF